jgi:murein DD-endopeptidase MepM/ murein hydrolase activator NlpD
VIGAVGQEDATYPHLHFEFRKGEPKEENSVHPLHYLHYPNTANFTQLRLDRCNFYRVGNDDKRAVRLCCEALERREGDVQGVDVELSRSARASSPGSFTSTSMTGRPSRATREMNTPSTRTESPWKATRNPI